MAKLPHTSESVIHVAITVLNLDSWLRAILFLLLGRTSRSFAGALAKPRRQA